MTVAKSLIHQRVEHDLAVALSRTDHEARRHRILAAAALCFSELGYQGASISGVARRAGVSTATIYQDFNNKTDLVYQCFAYLIPMYIHSFTQNEIAAPPFQRVHSMLMNYGKAMSDPFMTWLFRLYVSTTNDDASKSLASIAAPGQALVAEHWKAQLLALEQEGHIRPSSHETTINLLLGQIERRTILAQLLFGEVESGTPTLEAAALFATKSFFANLGTDAFHKAYTSH
jgi:AcrR family transcriptional regulator